METITTLQKLLENGYVKGADIVGDIMNEGCFNLIIHLSNGYSPMVKTQRGKCKVYKNVTSALNELDRLGMKVSILQVK